MKFLIALLVGLSTTVCLAGQVDVKSVRIWPTPEHTRIVFDVSAPVEHRLFTLENPHRVVVDLLGASQGPPGVRAAGESTLVARVRSAPRDYLNLRVVLDLPGLAKPKSFLLKPNAGYGHRLVVDLFPSAQISSGTQEVIKPEIIAPEVVEPEVIEPEKTKQSETRDIIIAIDPGHGGKDPGASGPRGTREKHITLALATRLAKKFEARRGMRAILIRTGDYYLNLRKRMQIARDNQVDLFISIHADAFHDPRVHGSSVYVLSRNGASSEAGRWLAARENAADLAGGVSLDDKDNLLASVLLDLSQTATLSASVDVGKDVLKELKVLGKTHKKQVERAGFVVLKSPDIPSILVEAAFISNPDEERKLLDPMHQDEIASSIFKGVVSYFERQAPPGTLLAQRSHIIARGDTLSQIAERYAVSLASLRSDNRLKGDSLQVGAILRIPIGS